MTPDRPRQPSPPGSTSEGGGLSRDLRRAGLLSGMGVVGVLDLLALEDLTTSVQPDYVAETLVLLASIPALIVLFTLWRRSAAPESPDPEAGRDG